MDFNKSKPKWTIFVGSNDTIPKYDAIKNKVIKSEKSVAH